MDLWCTVQSVHPHLQSRKLPEQALQMLLQSSQVFPWDLDSVTDTKCTLGPQTGVKHVCLCSVLSPVVCRSNNVSKWPRDICAVDTSQNRRDEGFTKGGFWLSRLWDQTVETFCPFFRDKVDCPRSNLQSWNQDFGFSPRCTCCLCTRRRGDRKTEVWNIHTKLLLTFSEQWWLPSNSEGLPSPGHVGLCLSVCLSVIRRNKNGLVGRRLLIAGSGR